MRIVLVLGAGGSDGGHFIDGALTELTASTGFQPEHSAAIIGTSIGAFRAATIGRAIDPPQPVSRAVRAMGGIRPEPTLLDRSARRGRLGLGRALARFVPRSRPAPRWATPPGPHHTGAAVVSIGLDRRQRQVHWLSTTPDPASVIRASAAVPFVVGPVIVDGRPHGDGAVWSPTNADLAATAEPAIIVIIAPMIPRTGGSPLDRLHRRQLRAELAELPPSASTVVVCPDPGPRGTTRTSQAGAAAVRALSKLQAERRSLT